MHLGCDKRLRLIHAIWIVLVFMARLANFKPVPMFRYNQFSYFRIGAYYGVDHLSICRMQFDFDVHDNVLMICVLSVVEPEAPSINQGWLPCERGAYCEYMVVCFS